MLITGCVCKIISAHNDVAPQSSLYLDSTKEKTEKSHFVHRRDSQNPHSISQKWTGGAEQTESGLRTQVFNEWPWADRKERLHVSVYLRHLQWASLHRQLSMGGRHQMTANTHHIIKQADWCLWRSGVRTHRHVNEEVKERWSYHRVMRKFTRCLGCRSVADWRRISSYLNNNQKKIWAIMMK